MLIRPYRESDESAVVALWREVFNDSRPHNDPVRSIRRKFEFGDQLVFVAEIDGAVVGTIVGGYDGHRGWIYRVAVSPAHRRHGIGSMLVRHVEGELEKRGCVKINLQVRSTNAAVVAFYQNLGYAVDDLISMGRIIES